MTPAVQSSAVSPVTIARDQLAHATVSLLRSQVVLIFTFVMPIVWLVLLGLLAGNAVLDDGVRVMQFASPNAIAMGTFFATMPPVAIAVSEAREKLVLKRIRGTPLPTWAYFFAQIGAACLFALGSLVVTLLLSVIVYGVRLRAETLPAMAATLLLGVASFSAVGLAIGSVSRSAAMAEAIAIGGAVLLSFISGLFFVGANLPIWLDRLASALPLKPYAVSLRNQFNPYAADAGWDVGALSILAAWGVVGALVSMRAFRWEPQRARTIGTAGGRQATGRRFERGAATGTTTRRASTLSLLAVQAASAMTVVTRRPGDFVFSFLMPIGLFLLLVTLQGTETQVNGSPIALGTAASMVAWGAGVSVFMNLAEGVARSRESRVLKRLRGTPLPAAVYLAGKAVAGITISILVLVTILILGTAVFGLRIGLPGLALGFGIALLGTVCLAACGFLLASLVSSARAVGAVGLTLLFVLSFFSDVFLATAPAWMGTVGSVFPLKHFQNALATAWASGGMDVPWLNILVLAVWAVLAGALAVWRFRWEPAAS
jgi:ABC-type multidrug transport system permease subunit